MAWAKTNGYHAENERTIIVGRLTIIRKKAYEGNVEGKGGFLKY